MNDENKIGSTSDTPKLDRFKEEVVSLRADNQKLRKANGKLRRENKILKLKLVVKRNEHAKYEIDHCVDEEVLRKALASTNEAEAKLGKMCLTKQEEAL